MGLAVGTWVTDAAMSKEYAANLGDSRRERRARDVGLAISKTPHLSFPKCFPEESALEGFYRLTENSHVTWRDLHDAHAARTVQRAAAVDEVLVVHDTTEVRFPTYWPDQVRSRLSVMSSGTQGMLAHASLAVTASGPAFPLGVLGLQPFVHRNDLKPEDAATRAFWLDEGGLHDNESERWFRAVEDAQTRLSATKTSAIHVMDRETDNISLLMWMAQETFRFVVRGNTFRKNVAGIMREIGIVDVHLGEVRPHGSAKDDVSHPPRRTRQARLSVRAGEVVLKRKMKKTQVPWSPTEWSSLPTTLKLNMVEAIEIDPPSGEAPVRWLLLTREPIATEADVLRVIDIYRRRWLIEEYFKALKSGCLLEQRQADSAPALLRVLALLVPAAWRLLLLRRQGEEDPDAPWQTVLAPLEFELLQQAVPKAKLTKDATAQQCMRAVAKLGGHLPRNGRPGWQTLHAGWQLLNAYVEGVRLLQRARKSKSSAKTLAQTATEAIRPM